MALTTTVLYLLCFLFLEPLYQRALHVRQDYYGDSHPQLAEVYMSLASLLRTKGNYVGSLSAYEKALFNYEHHFGPKHPKVCYTDNTIIIIVVGSVQARVPFLTRPSMCVGD